MPPPPLPSFPNTASEICSAVLEFPIPPSPGDFVPTTNTVWVPIVGAPSTTMEDVVEEVRLVAATIMSKKRSRLQAAELKFTSNEDEARMMTRIALVLSVG